MQLLKQDSNVSVSELSRRFGVSEVTIRKDLNLLKERNLLVRTRGGAIMHEVGSQDDEVAKLVALIDETQGVSVIFITPKLDSRLIDGIAEASSLINNVSSSGAVELFYYNPADCILDPAEKERHKELAESCKAQLSTKGVTVAELRI